MRKKIRYRNAQQESEYGSACLAMLADYYGKYISLFQAAQVCDVTQEGCSMEQIRDGADALGFQCKFREDGAEGLLSADLPCIVSVDGKYSVLSKINGKKAVLYLPDQGRVTMKRTEFDQACGSRILLMRPSKTGFKPEKEKPSVAAFALRLVTRGNLRRTILYILLLWGVSMLMLAITQLSSDFTDSFFSVAVDQAVENLKAGEMHSQLAMLITSLIIMLILEVFLVYVFSRFSEKISIGCRRSYLWSAINLPLDEYQLRSDGYFMGSEDQVTSVSYFLSKQIVEVILRPLLAAGFLVLMARVSISCCLVVLCSVVIMAAACIISSGYEDRYGRIVFAGQNKESGFLLEGLKAIRSIRNSGSEFMFFREYVRLNRESAKTLRKYNEVKKIFADLPMSIDNFDKLLLILIGIFNVFRGSMTFGQLVYVHGIYCIVSGYIRSTVHSAQDILSLRYQLENMKEICEEAEQYGTSGEESSGSRASSETETDSEEEFRKLDGHICLSHVCFGYSRRAGEVIKDVSIDIPAGSSVAFVGASGCGKTTLKKLICGRYQPWEGEIFYDGHPAGEVPKQVLSGSIASVDQQIILFEDTIMNNIKMWDPTQYDFDAILAARDAEIHNDIIRRERGYKALLSENGNNLSGGQRQRIEIARALSMDPSVLVLDEATSALDTIVEKRIVDHVRGRGITTIVVAHRLSTIRDCDCIYVFDAGRIIGQGTHDELMRSCELYQRLVTVA